MPLSSQRQRFSIFVSPRNEDFLFYEKVDKQRVQESIPEYGDPHPDFRKYPNHFFTQSVQADEEGQTYFYYYAAKRDHQDDYNFEHSTVNHKSGTYDQVTRTYITLRSEYDEDSPALGSLMPIVDADPFDVSDKYTLISREQSRVGETVGISSKRNPDEMDSMFVLEKCVYLKRAPITTTAYDKQTGAHIFTTTNLVHRDETPEGSSLTVAGLIADSSNPFWDVDEETGSHKVIEQVSEEWYYVSSVQNGEANERRVFLYLTPNQNDFVFYELVDRRNEKLEPDPLPAFGDAHSEFTDHKFVAAVPNDNIGDFYKFYYARDRFNEDQYNFSESFVDIGGVRVSLVRRSYVVLRDDYDPNYPEVGATMPTDPSSKFTGGYLLVDRLQRPIEDETLSSLYVSEERVYAKTPEVGSQEGNFTLQEGGLTVTRTWIVPRDEVGAFPQPSIGSSDPEYGQYEYATRRISQETPAEIDSYFSVVLDIYAKKGWAFQEEHQYNIGYKIIETSTLEDDKDGEGNYTVSFDERGWQRKQRSAELTGFEYESQVETRPYGKITTNTSAGTEPIVGQNNTRSRIVFDDGTLQIYQRDEDTFTIKEGSAGQEKNEQIYASITTNKFYRTSGDVLTETGSSRVIYDDGTTQVYEVSEESVVAKEGGDAGQTIQKTASAIITTSSIFSQYGDVTGDTGSSRVVYRGGGVTIYQVDNEVATLPSNTDAGETKQQTIFANISTASEFRLSPTIGTDTGSSRVAYRGGGIVIYQVDEETTTVTSNTDAGETIQKTASAKITTTSTYAESGDVTGDTGSSRVVYRGGGVILYQIDTEVATLPSNTDAGETKQQTVFADISTASEFRLSPTIGTDTGSSRVAYRGGGIVIYQVDEETTTVTSNTDAGETIQKTASAKITTTSTYAESGDVTGDTGSSRVVYRGGGVILYQIDNEVAELPSNTDAGETKQQTVFADISTASEFRLSPTIGTDTGSSRVAYRGGGIVIYQVDEETTTVTSNTDAGETIQKTASAKITTTSTYAESGDVTGDTGSSRVVYRGGGVILYQIDNEVAELPSNTDAGETKQQTVFADISTASEFRLSPTIGTDTGSSRVAYRGGGIVIYQVDEETTTVTSNTDAGETIQQTASAKITTTSTYAESGDVTGDTGSSRVVYRGGGVILYQIDNEVAELPSNTDAGETKQQTIFANISTASEFRLSPTIGTDTGSSRVAYRGGGIVIYQVDEETTTVTSNTDAGETKEARLYGTLTTTGTYSQSSAITGDIGRSRVVYRGGGTIIYQVDVEDFAFKAAENGETKESTIYATITTKSKFASSGSVTSTGNSRLVYNDGTTEVYQVDEVTDIEPNSDYTYTVKTSVDWGHLDIKTYFNDTGTADDPDKINRIRVVYRGEAENAAIQVFQIDEETPQPKTAEFTSAKETNPYFTSETFTKYDKTPNETPATTEEVRNTAVYNNATEVVYRIDRTVFTPEPPVTYESTVNKRLASRATGTKAPKMVSERWHRSFLIFPNIHRGRI